MSAAMSFPEMPEPQASFSQSAADLSDQDVSHQHDDFDPYALDACTAALAQVHAFLHNELLAAQADLIRVHLDGCENCVDNFDIEATITKMIQRSCPPETAPMTLRVRIMSLRVQSLDFDA